MELRNKCLAKSGVITKPGITMIIVVGLKNAGLKGKRLASSVWQGIHEDPEIYRVKVSSQEAMSFIR